MHRGEFVGGRSGQLASNLLMNPFRRSPLQTHRVSGDGRGWVDTVAVPLFAANASIYVAISPLRDGLFGKSGSCQIGLCVPPPE